jgi:hypothetical protein
MTAATMLCVENANLAVENERTRWQLGDGRSDVSESRRVIDAATGNQADVPAIFERQDAPPVFLPLIHPAVLVERLANERRVHRLDEGKGSRGHRRSLYQTGNLVHRATGALALRVR